MPRLRFEPDGGGAAGLEEVVGFAARAVGVLDDVDLGGMGGWGEVDGVLGGDGVVVWEEAGCWEGVSRDWGGLGGNLRAMIS